LQRVSTKRDKKRRRRRRRRKKKLLADRNIPWLGA
jgi:hypothetical protein